MLRWNSGTYDGGTGEQKWWKVDQLTVEQLNNYGGTVEHLMVGHSNRDVGSVKERWWNS